MDPLYRNPVVRQDNTYVAPIESRLAARNRTVWHDIRETGQLVSAIGQGIQHGGDWLADRLGPLKHVSPLPDVISGVGRSLGGTLDAVGCLPLVAEETVKNPKKVGQTVLAAVPHLLDDYQKTWKERGPVATTAQLATDVFGFGWVKKGLGLTKAATKSVARQQVKALARQEVKGMSRRTAVQIVSREFPEVTAKQFKKMPSKQQKQLARQAVTRGAVRELRHMARPNVSKAIKQSVSPPSTFQHALVHGFHHAIHWFSEESAKHSAKGVARPH